MSLPAAWVDKLFAKLTVVYGRDFLGRWEGIPSADVKTDWANELGGFFDAPESIAYALEHLPADKPPTVLQFRDLCRRAPAPKRIALEAPKSSPEVIAKVAPALRSMTAPKGYDPKGWAKALKDREQRGKGLTAFQRKAWREVLEPKTFDQGEQA